MENHMEYSEAIEALRRRIEGDDGVETRELYSLNIRAVSALSALTVLLAAEGIALEAADNRLPWKKTYEVVSSVMAETAQLLSDSGMHPAALRDALMQPKGALIKAHCALEDEQLRAAVNAASRAVLHALAPINSEKK